MCAKCLGRLESWEEFKQICVSSNKCIQEHLNQSKKETPNLLPYTPEKIEDGDHSKCDSVFNDEPDFEISDNDESSKPKSPVLITVT